LPTEAFSRLFQPPAAATISGWPRRYISAIIFTRLLRHYDTPATQITPLRRHIFAAIAAFTPIYAASAIADASKTLRQLTFSPLMPRLAAAITPLHSHTLAGGATSDIIAAFDAAAIFHAIFSRHFRRGHAAGH
jgi:hypothetical protein